MSIDIRQPNIQGTDHEMLLALRSYLFQLREQLQYAFDDLEKNGTSGGGGSGTAMTTVVQQTIQPSGQTSQNSRELFESIKSYIITSGEILTAYHNRIEDRLLEDKVFVAENDFGKYQESVKTTFDAVDGSVKLTSEAIEAIEGRTSAYNTTNNYAEVIQSKGYVKAGFLGEEKDGTQIYGVEVGFVDSENQKSVGRFASNKIVFFSPSGAEGAWINNLRMHAKSFEAEDSLYVGGFIDEVDINSGDVTTRWVGKEGI